MLVVMLHFARFGRGTQSVPAAYTWCVGNKPECEFWQCSQACSAADANSCARAVMLQADHNLNAPRDEWELDTPDMAYTMMVRS
jgi:hypothetical protein